MDLATPLGMESVADLQRLREGVLALLRAELRDFALADDLCHEAFRIVLERLARQPLDDPSRLAAFLAQTARNLVIEHRRRTVRQRRLAGQQAIVEEPADPEPGPEYALLQESRVRAVRQLLREIESVRDRELLVRVYLHDQDKATVCRELGIDEDNYKFVLHRARGRMAMLLGRRYGRSDLFCIALF